MDLTADDAVAATNDDASMCKYQAINKGYYKDEFLNLFLSSKMKNSTTRKAPEINRGYYARSASIAYLVEQFVKANPFGQIISIGAGYDSLYWRLKSQKFFLGNQDNHIKYIEIDMSPVVLHKMMAIKRQSKLSSLLSSVQYKREGMHSDDYHLFSFDLRQVQKESLKQRLSEDCQVDYSKPTLCLIECVLVYMPTQDSESLIKWLTDNFKNLALINYEQCNMNDRFGEIMLASMTDRHCDLMGVDACRSIESQESRLKANGFQYTKAWTMSEIYKKILAPAEIERIEKLEFLDEKELLDQLLDHYCIVIGANQELTLIPDDQFWFAESSL